MRLLQVHNAYALRGGEDTITETEAALLRAAGHDVHTISAQNPTSGVAAVTRLLQAPLNRAGSRSVKAAAGQFKPDLAHVHNTWFSLSPEVFHALKSFGLPVVMTLQNYRPLCVNAQLFRNGHPCTDCVGRGPWTGVRHRCYRGSLLESAAAATTISVARNRRSFERVDRFLAPSHFVKNLFVDAGFDPRRIIVRPNCVGDPGGRPSPPSRSTTVLYAGRLSAEKGVETLVEGWRRCKLASRGFTLRIVGEGPLASQQRDQAPAGVEFAGWLSSEALSKEMHRCRALVFPSEWYENFGRVIIEAFAAGLPVMASDIATPAELVAPLGSSWLVPSGNADSWGTALGRLTDDRFVDAAGQAARDQYLDRYTLSLGLLSLLAAYQEARESTLIA